MRTVKQRFLITLAATLLAGAFGLLLTLMLDGLVLLRSAENKLGEQAVNLLKEVGAILNESHAALRAMNASQAPLCSDAEIAAFRKLVFNSEFLRDAGRIRNGTIECSAALGRENLPVTQFKPSTTMPDGSSLYGDISPYQPHDQSALGQQIGESYVVLDPHAFKRMDAISTNRSATVIDAVSHQLHHPGRLLPKADGVITDRNWGGYAGNYLFATRCAPSYPICMTTYTPIPVVLAARRGQLVGYTTLGGVIGALFGFLCSRLYRRNQSMEQQLRRAITKDKLRVVYQPIVNLASGMVVGAEALARWTDEDGLAVAPDVFIKLAEERGFVGCITEIVVRHALCDFGETLRRRPAFRLSINVAAADLADPGFLPMLELAVKQAKVPARSLAIEITESSTVRYKIAMETILLLRQKGYSVHIDDFGTGYSSLAYLHDLSVDAIKIDKAFTQAIGTGSVIVVILPQILSIAEALNLEVIVEGVETKEQAIYFANPTGQILAQGWLFGRPVHANEFYCLFLDEEKKQRAVPVESA